MRVQRPQWLTLSFVLVAALVVNAELAVDFAYLSVMPVSLTDPLVYAYPWVWIDAALLAVYVVSPARTSRRHWYAAAVLGVAYFLVMAYFGGLVGPGGGRALGLSLHWLPPGYGPAVIYVGALVKVVVEPYKVVGYAALAYLVYVTVTDTSPSMLSGFVGLFSCVSCTWPLLATVFTGLFGSASAVASVATTQALGLSTVVFTVSLALLAWRPRLPVSRP